MAGNATLAAPGQEAAHREDAVGPRRTPRAVAGDRHRYRFRQVWPLAASPGRVYAVLERAAAYPSWWPQVRAVRADGWGGAARFRSLLPYVLRIDAVPSRWDPVARVLEIRMSGDLVGWARWTVLPGGPGAVLLFEQRVELRKRSLRWAGPLARPLLTANHAWMMRAGRKGLRRVLESGLDDA
ncbi:SRPBCC family protein [Streptomyces sp. AJS327]|uniref:SRPBCC family protein n=1 Tax=Streptomyces sp. AJS327 TaxID=2545265 RepID=UPI0015DF1F20|nr:SRPBCC family protein [Streptomyces sp. AJS327]